MNRWLALLFSILGGAFLGYWLLRFLFDALAMAGYFTMVDGPPLPLWADELFSVALIAAGLACWALCSWAIWRLLRPHRSEPDHGP